MRTLRPARPTPPPAPDQEPSVRRYATPAPLTVVVDISGAELRVTAGEVAETTVELRPHDPGRTADVELAEGTSLDHTGDRLVIRAPRSMRHRLRTLVTSGGRVDLALTVPTGSALEVRGWADVAVEGVLAAADIDTDMGDIVLAEVGRLRAKTSMGDVRVGTTTGGASARTSAGSIRVERAAAGLEAKTSAGDITVADGHGDLTLTTSAGDVRVDRADGTVVATTSAGDVRVGRADGGVVTARTSYGRIDVGIAPDTAAWLDVEARAGTVRSELDGTDGPGDAARTVEVHARTGHGDIALRRA